MADEKKVNGAEVKSADKKVEKKPKSNKPPFATRVKNFVKDYKSEMKKVVWSPKKEVIKNTGIVLVLAVGVGVAVGVLDLGLSELIKLLGNIN